MLGEPAVRRAVRVTNTSLSGMTLEMDRPAAVGSRLRIEFQGATALGEAVRCRPAKGSYYVGIRLEQALNSLADLARMVEELEGQGQEGSVRMP